MILVSALISFILTVFLLYASACMFLAAFRQMMLTKCLRHTHSANMSDLTALEEMIKITDTLSYSEAVTSTILCICMRSHVIWSLIDATGFCNNLNIFSPIYSGIPSKKYLSDMTYSDCASDWGFNIDDPSTFSSGGGKGLNLVAVYAAKYHKRISDNEKLALQRLVDVDPFSNPISPVEAKNFN